LQVHSRLSSKKGTFLQFRGISLGSCGAGRKGKTEAEG
jgi:hypothetical protein